VTTPVNSPLSSEDERAAAGFYRQYHKPLLRYLIRKVRSRDTAAEIAQITWAGFFRKRGWENETPVRFLYGIARKQVAGWFRARKLDTVPLPDEPNEYVNIANSARIDTDALGVRLVVERELRRCLTAPQHKVVELRFCFDLDRRATAEIMGITVSGVKSHEEAALKKLRTSQVLVQLWREREGARA
jgi:RNA polymerase sigma factor (sigma-70 family)